MARIPEALVPRWERHYPGRLEWELAALEKRAKDLQIDDGQLRNGLLVVRFSWPFNGGHIPLEATFPASYPFLRPQVRLLSDRKTWPARHVSPVDGNICLLGRDSAQWTTKYWLAELLEKQLEDALLGTGKEDPQGEPAEVWWNGIAPLPGSYCLVDSAWNFGNATDGRLEVRYAMSDKHDLLLPIDRGLPPPFHAVVMRIMDKDGVVVATWDRPLPLELASSRRTMTIRWHRFEETLLPEGNVASQLATLRKTYFGGAGMHHGIGSNLAFRPFVLVHRIEVAQNEMGLGWIVGGEWGSIRDFNNKKAGRGHEPRGKLLPVMRAGKTDLGYRVPAVAALNGKRVGVFGVGAIGAPIAIELARNGCSVLYLIDHDIVEPGNSIRWPLGAEAWGQQKVAALAGHIRRQFPGVSVIPHSHQLGSPDPAVVDDVLLDEVLADVDLVVDATAASGVHYLLWDRCSRVQLPLVRVGATPSVKGGTVVRHTPGGGCPVCLQYARDGGRIDIPPGAEEALLIQPPGCGERTFVGADYDLQELSLQATRLVVNTLSANEPVKSVVQTLSLVDGDGRAILPRWTVQDLPQQPECCDKA